MASAIATSKGGIAVAVPPFTLCQSFAPILSAMRRIGESASIALALVVGAYQLGFADDAVRGTRQLLMGSEEPPPGADDPWSPNYVAPAPGPYFRNCGEARATGVAPLYAGDPGYRGGLDRDRDGVACEPYRGR